MLLHVWGWNLGIVVNEAFLALHVCSVYIILYLFVPYNAIGCTAAHGTAIGNSCAPALYSVDYTKDDIHVHL